MATREETEAAKAQAEADAAKAQADADAAAKAEADAAQAKAQADATKSTSGSAAVEGAERPFGTVTADKSGAITHEIDAPPPEDGAKK